jgi:hypothetical protein
MGSTRIHTSKVRRPKCRTKLHGTLCRHYHDFDLRSASLGQKKHQHFAHVQGKLRHEEFIDIPLSAGAICTQIAPCLLLMANNYKHCDIPNTLTLTF